MNDKCYFMSPVGVICIEGNGEAVTSLYLDRDYYKDAKQKQIRDAVREWDLVDQAIFLSEPHTKILRMAADQLWEYFKGQRTVFTVSLEPSGTEFQKRVWKALCDIPYGETRSYGEIASYIGKPKACRAVGGANNKNSILIFIPCHRVIGADGSLVGFGCGLEVKQFLLGHENIWKRS